MTRALAIARSLFAVALCITLVSLLAPGNDVIEFKGWVATWLPMASVLDAADATVHSDKLVHATLFALLGWLAARSWLDKRQRWWALVGLLLLGVATELLQSLVPGRSASVGDWLADAVGLVCGFWLALAGHSRRVSAARVAV